MNVDQARRALGEIVRLPDGRTARLESVGPADSAIVCLPGQRRQRTVVGDLSRIVKSYR